MASNVRFATQAPAARSSLKRDLIGAALAGQVAGLLMAVAMIAVFTLVLGAAWYQPMQLIGAFAWGEAALPGHFLLPVFVTGLVIHQAVAALGSLLFGKLINEVSSTFGNVLALGLATAALAQVIDTALVLPAMVSRFQGAGTMPLGWSWLVHGVFGLGFLVYLPIRLWLRRTSRAYSHLASAEVRS